MKYIGFSPFFAAFLILVACCTSKGGNSMDVVFHDGSVNYEKGSAVAPDAELRCDQPIASCKYAVYVDRNGNGEMEPDELKYSAKRDIQAVTEPSGSVVLKGGEFKVEKGEGRLYWTVEVRFRSGATWHSSGQLSDAVRSSK